MHLVRCRIVDCNATGASSGAMNSWLYDSIVEECGSDRVVREPYMLENCTIKANSAEQKVLYDNGTSGGTAKKITARNSIVAGNVEILNSGNDITNCLFTGSNTASSPYVGWAAKSRIVTEAELDLDENLVPRIGTSVAVDAGDHKVFAAAVGGESRTSDICGTQRIYNARVDIGALEADWRPEYAAMLCGQTWFDMTEATKGAVTNNAGGVRLPAEESLSVAFANYGGARARAYGLAFTVNAGSAAAVTFADGTVKTYDTPGEYFARILLATGAEGRMTLACTAGSIDVSAARCHTGMITSFR